MTLHAWLLFSATETLLCLSPGPAVLFVLSHGLTQGGRASLWANLGILTCNACYFVLSALGLGAALLTSHALFTFVRRAGALYLVYLGARTFRGTGLALPAAGDAGARAYGWRALARGCALQAANPKAILFFVALLPQFMNSQRAILPQVALLGVTSLGVEFLVLAGYGYLAGRAAARLRRPGFVLRLNRTSGLLLAAAGVGLALTREK